MKTSDFFNGFVIAYKTLIVEHDMSYICRDTDFENYSGFKDIPV